MDKNFFKKHCSYIKILYDNILKLLAFKKKSSFKKSIGESSEGENVPLVLIIVNN